MAKRSRVAETQGKGNILYAEAGLADIFDSDLCLQFIGELPKGNTFLPQPSPQTALAHVKALRDPLEADRPGQVGENGPANLAGDPCAHLEVLEQPIAKLRQLRVSKLVAVIRLPVEPGGIEGKPVLGPIVENRAIEEGRPASIVI